MSGYPPEPWRLTGDACLSMWRLPVDDVPGLPAGAEPILIAGHASVFTAWIDYRPPGQLSYHELLCAVAVHGRGLAASITQIWVDSEISRDGGRALWGIPKDLASFGFTGGRTFTAATGITTDTDTVTATSAAATETATADTGTPDTPATYTATADTAATATDDPAPTHTVSTAATGTAAHTPAARTATAAPATGSPTSTPTVPTAATDAAATDTAATNTATTGTAAAEGTTADTTATGKGTTHPPTTGTDTTRTTTAHPDTTHTTATHPDTTHTTATHPDTTHTTATHPEPTQPDPTHPAPTGIWIATAAFTPRAGLPFPLPARFEIAQTLGGRLTRTPVRWRARPSLAAADWAVNPAGPLGHLAGKRPVVSAVLRGFTLEFGPREASTSRSE
ncbi:acetoacetate decarboxylase family protein [Amycolatopsis sulphurea]|uniref:acetoacetate decarboxylase family protein n=1 Tax=Amycolatopsis sulphurea TaxID=76022 RepID=UPI002482F442|nr:acetoacetate decarboxylase family protein [Amycolatopsis sulphurea]